MSVRTNNRQTPVYGPNMSPTYVRAHPTPKLAYGAHSAAERGLLKKEAV